VHRTLRCSHSGSAEPSCIAPCGAHTPVLPNRRASHQLLPLRRGRRPGYKSGLHTGAGDLLCLRGDTDIHPAVREHRSDRDLHADRVLRRMEYRGRRAMQKLRGHGPARPHDRVQPLHDPVPQLRLCALLPVQPGVYGEMPCRRSRRGQRSSRTIAMACFGHSFAQMPHPLQ
jgi:hypothetical protein